MDLYNQLNHALADNNIDFECILVKEQVVNSLGLFYKSDDGLLWSNVHGLASGEVSIELSSGVFERVMPDDLARFVSEKVIIAPCYPYRIKSNLVRVLGYWDEENVEFLLWPKSYSEGLIVTVPKSQIGLVHTIFNELECNEEYILVDTLKIWRDYNG